MEPNTTVTRTTVSSTPVSTTPVISTDPVIVNNKQEFGLAKINQVVWFITGLINIIIALRFIMLLLGANAVSIVGLVYNLSYPFVVPFYGIFGQPRIGESYFETASLVAILVYTLIAYLITSLLSIMSKRTV